jgi:hypothetical protein
MSCYQKRGLTGLQENDLHKQSTEARYCDPFRRKQICKCGNSGKIDAIVMRLKDRRGSAQKR